MKLGIIIITHGNIAVESLKTLKAMLGEIKKIEAISVDITYNIGEIQDHLEKKIKSFLKSEGKVLIFTDIFGGTPSNLSFGFLKKDKVEVITGFNLPMLIKTLTIREYEDDMELKELSSTIVEYGKNNIHIASNLVSEK